MLTSFLPVDITALKLFLEFTLKTELESAQKLGFAQPIGCGGRCWNIPHSIYLAASIKRPIVGEKSKPVALRNMNFLFRLLLAKTTLFRLPH